MLGDFIFTAVAIGIVCLIACVVVLMGAKHIDEDLEAWGDTTGWKEPK